MPPGGIGKRGNTGRASSYQRLPRTISFDGRGNWRAFLHKFTAFADQQQWDFAQRANQLSWCLEGKAGDYLSLTLEQEPGMGYFPLVQILGKRFDHGGLPESAQLEFASAKQGPEESLPEWSDRVLGLALRAFTGAQGPYSQQQAVLRLCQGCLNREAGCHALTQHPATVGEAIGHIQWHQHVYRAMYGRGASR